MIAWNETLIRLSLAAFLGALIGLERERKNWAAGLRTHMLVCVGSCLVMIVSAFGFYDVLETNHINLDPSRIAAQVISGIGFIGAGSILFLKQGTVRGLTTAAGLWTVAAIGLATGGGLYFAAGATTIIALIILWALQPLEKMLAAKFTHQSLKIVTDANADCSNLLQTLSNQKDLKINSYTMTKSKEKFTYLIQFDHVDKSTFDNIISEFEKEPFVKEITWNQ